MKTLLGVTGSVASKLTPHVVEALLLEKFDVQVVTTEPSLFFWDPQKVSVQTFRDKDEWLGSGYKSGDKVLHIELRNWADILVIAPASANTLAKIANGMCDNLLTSVVRAWDRNKPIILAPAMNTHMWDHPVTQEHLSRIKLWYPKLAILGPVSKTLACGDVGMGAMTSIANVIESVSQNWGGE